MALLIAYVVPLAAFLIWIAPKTIRAYLSDRAIHRRLHPDLDRMEATGLARGNSKLVGQARAAKRQRLHSALGRGR